MKAGRAGEVQGVATAPSERWALVAPVVCAVHCLATPILLVVAPAIAGSWQLEGILMLVAILFSVPAIWRGYSLHRRAEVWLPAVLGALLWGAELAGLFSVVPGVLLTLTGSTLMAGALLWNFRLRRHFSVCGCPAHS